MTTDVADRPKAPKPKWGMFIAVLLELSMLSIFAYNRSLVGALVWIVYFRFSATRALMEDWGVL